MEMAVGIRELLDQTHEEEMAKIANNPIKESPAGSKRILDAFNAERMERMRREGWGDADI